MRKSEILKQAIADGILQLDELNPSQRQEAQKIYKKVYDLYMDFKEDDFPTKQIYIDYVNLRETEKSLRLKEINDLLKDNNTLESDFNFRYIKLCLVGMEVKKAY